MIGVNLWDDYGEGEETFIYIEEMKVSHDTKKCFLESIIPKIDNKYKPRMFFYRAFDKYPEAREKFKNDPDMLEYFENCQRWEIRLSIPWEEKDIIIDKLNETKFKTEFKFYSES